MTADEAKQALKEGKKVTHKFWANNSYLVEESHILFNGVFVRDTIFEEMEDIGDWEIV
jgi:hypothetical protein